MVPMTLINIIFVLPVSGVPPSAKRCDYRQRTCAALNERDLVPLLVGVSSVGGHRYRLYRPRREGGGEFVVPMRLRLAPSRAENHRWRIRRLSASISSTKALYQGAVRVR